MVSYSRIPNVDNGTGEEFCEFTFSEFDNNDDLRLVERRRTRWFVIAAALFLVVLLGLATTAYVLSVRDDNSETENSNNSDDSETDNSNSDGREDNVIKEFIASRLAEQLKDKDSSKDHLGLGFPTWEEVVNQIKEVEQRNGNLVAVEVIGRWVFFCIGLKKHCISLFCWHQQLKLAGLWRGGQSTECQ